MKIHLAIAFDMNYLLPFHALLASVLDNHDPEKVVFHLIAGGVNEEERESIRSAARNRAEVFFYDESFLNETALVISGSWTTAVYYRLLFPLLIPEHVSRMIYLDADTLVLKDLGQLYQSDLEGFPVAAVYDNYVRTQELIGLTQEGNYFNSGVMLIDVKAWQKGSITERALDYVKQNPSHILFVDQCALNAVLMGNWKRLDPCFNLLYTYLPEMMSNVEMKEIESRTFIVHFTLQRPWRPGCRNRFRHRYNYYLTRSGKKAKDRFSFREVYQGTRIRMEEMYADFPVLRTLWRIIKLPLKISRSFS